MMDRHDDSNEKRLNQNVGEEGGKDGSVVHRSSHNVPSRTSDPNFWGPTGGAPCPQPSISCLLSPFVPSDITDA